MPVVLQWGYVSPWGGVKALRGYVRFKKTNILN